MRFPVRSRILIAMRPGRASVGHGDMEWLINSIHRIVSRRATASERGQDWLLENQDKLVLRCEPRTPSGDAEIPF